MVNRDRLTRVFQELVQIDSVSKKEGAVAQVLQKTFESLGAEVVIDGAGPKVESESGNLIARFQGTNTQVAPLLLNAHMDTVQPGEGIRIVFSDGVFSSDGTTILGADDKSALAVIIETIRVLQERGIPHGPLEVVVTVCEEVGLLGAKNLDYSLLKAEYGYSLDASDPDGIVIRAPAANHIHFRVLGRDAHAGAAPEKGINAIQLAGRAIAKMPIGRIDKETTANIGLIQGGTATNIVPGLVTLTGEVRSHSPEKLDRETKRIVQCLEEEISAYKKAFPADDGLPRCEAEIREDFSVMKTPEDHLVVAMAREAATRLGREMKTKTSGGGSDANIFFGHGIVTGILGTGMKDLHTVRESIRLDDMVKSVELLLEIIQLHTKQPPVAPS
ncbi:MAG: M20/M25/M40 family metallo-hydrolase [Thermodesulfobacteriota bacterium]|nr:M20/M25/M40 family metallo-hydrolase [Thermodesulfobacteriota bacterium]